MKKILLLLFTFIYFVSFGQNVNLTLPGIPQANASTSGYISNIDWAFFNAKQPAGTYLVPGDTVSLRNGLNATAANVATNTTNIAANTTAISGKEPSIGNPSTSGYILSSTAGGVRSWIASGAALSKQVLTSGTSVTISNGTSWLLVKPALSTLTITLPAIPTDGQKIEISFFAAVGSLTVSPNSGQTISDVTGLGSISAGETIQYKYDITDSIWYRL